MSAFLTVFKSKMGVFPQNPDEIEDFRIHLMVDLLEQYGWKYIMITKYYKLGFYYGGFRVNSRCRFLKKKFIDLYVDIPNNSSKIVVVATIEDRYMPKSDDYSKSDYSKVKCEIDLVDPNSIQKIEEFLGQFFRKLFWFEFKWLKLKRWWWQRKLFKT